MSLITDDGGIQWRPPPPDEPVVPEGPSAEERAAELFSRAVGEMREALALMPQPVVNVEHVDLAEIATAIQGIKGPATADEIADAIARKIVPAQAAGDGGVVEAIRELVDKIDWRLKGVGAQAFGASGPSNISSDPERLLGHVSVDNYPATQAVSLASLPAVTQDSGAYLGYVSPSFARKVGEGRAWITGKRIESSLGGSIAFLLRNPSTSDRGAYIVRLRLVATAATEVRVFDSDKVGAPSATANSIALTNGTRTAVDEVAIRSQNFVQGVSTTTQKAFSFYTENGVVSKNSGGVYSAPAASDQWTDIIFLPANQAQTLAFDGPYVLGVNKTIAFEVTMPAGSVFYLTMYHYEG